MNQAKVMVVCATGKVGKNVSLALHEAGFKVYGTTRSENNTSLSKRGITPVVCNYVDKDSLRKAFKETGCTKAFLLTDFFQAAKSSQATEIQQGKDMIDVCKEAKCDFVIYSSCADAEFMNDKVKHMKGKLVVEKYLFASGLDCAVLRPVAFFENYDDPANWNPLNEGHVKFLTEVPVKMCATYDIGRAAAKMFQNPSAWNGKTLDVVGWEGGLKDVAAALQKVSGTKTTYSLAMPKFFRWLMLNDLHNMCLYFENEGGFKSSIEQFKKVVSNPMSAEDWFRSVGKYSNGKSFN